MPLPRLAGEGLRGTGCHQRYIRVFGFRRIFSEMNCVDECSICGHQESN